MKHASFRYGMLTTAAAAGLLLSLPLAQAANPSFWQEIGYEQLRNELGAATPDGAGVRVAQIELYPVSGATDPSFPGVTFSFHSGAPGYVDGHAKSVATYYYGGMSIAQGISDVDLWTGITGLLMAASTKDAPPVDPSYSQDRVISHSYVGNVDNTYLRRFDYTINRDQQTQVVATDNLGSPPWPQWASCYNGIVATKTTGGMVGGVIGDLDGAGRNTPMLAVPVSFTSYAAPVVASAAALLWQTAGDPSDAGNRLAKAAHPESVKAALLAGATKNEPAFAHPWTHSPTEPLDYYIGAGELNIYNSWHIVNAGPQPRGAGTHAAADYGFDYNTVSTAASSIYYLDIAAGQTMKNLSIILTWNRLITPRVLDDGSESWDIPLWYLANLDLKLYQADGDSLGTLLDQSISWQYNTEHIWYTGELGPGRYAIQVQQLNAANSDNPNTTYAIAWTSELSSVPEPTAALLLAALGWGPLLRRPRRGN